MFLGFPSSVWAILGIEFVERLGYYAVAFSLFTYCTLMLRAGAVLANALINVVYILIPAAAFVASGVADSKVGRPRVLALSLAIYTTSLVLLSFSATPILYDPFPTRSLGGGKAIFIVALLGFSIGYGSMKVCTTPLMADCLVRRYRSVLRTSPCIDDLETREAAEDGKSDVALAELCHQLGVRSDSADEERETARWNTTAVSPVADAAARTKTQFSPSIGALRPPVAMVSAVSALANPDVPDMPCDDELVKHVLSRLFIYFYWVTNVGGLIGTLVAPLLRNFDSRHVYSGSEEYSSGYYWSFLLAAGSVGLGGVLLCPCYGWLPRNDPAPTFVLVRVLALAVRNRAATFRGELMMQGPSAVGNEILTNPRDFLDFAALKSEPTSLHYNAVSDMPPYGFENREDAATDRAATQQGGSTALDDKDMLFTARVSEWVVDCRATLRVCRTFVALPIYWLICNQFSTNLMYQASALNLPPDIPEELFNNVNTLTMLLFLMLWDRCLLPWVLHRQVPSARLRITIGFTCMSVSMLWCGLLQRFITRRGYYNGDDSYVVRDGEHKLSAGWLIMPYVLQGVAAAFVDPTVMEVAYRDAPERMRGTVMGLYWVASSASGFLGLLLSPVMRPCNAEILFFSFAVAQMAVSGVFYRMNG